MGFTKSSRERCAPGARRRAACARVPVCAPARRAALYTSRETNRRPRRPRPPSPVSYTHLTLPTICSV
eukprot:5055697-Prymnesium_polylepis.1